MCEVVGQVRSMRTVSVASIPVTVSSSRITSGTWQEALTIASKPVRATETRNPAVLNCASRTSRDTASPAAINTSGATPRPSAGGVATTAGGCGVVRDRDVAFRCTTEAVSKNVAQKSRFAIRDSPGCARCALAPRASAIHRFGDSRIRGSGIQGLEIQDQ